MRLGGFGCGCHADFSSEDFDTAECSCGAHGLGTGEWEADSSVDGWEADDDALLGVAGRVAQEGEEGLDDLEGDEVGGLEVGWIRIL